MTRTSLQAKQSSQVHHDSTTFQFQKWPGFSWWSVSTINMCCLLHDESCSLFSPRYNSVNCFHSKIRRLMSQYFDSNRYTTTFLHYLGLYLAQIIVRAVKIAKITPQSTNSSASKKEQEVRQFTRFLYVGTSGFENSGKLKHDGRDAYRSSCRKA